MKREANWDLLRIIACFAVVLTHAAAGHWNVAAPDSLAFSILTVYDSPGQFGMPIFYMMSGMFLCNPAKKMPVKKWAARMAKLAVCFFLWSLFYAFQRVLDTGFRNGFDSVDSSMWSDAMAQLATGHFHMWFLLELMGFYLLLPLLRKVCEDVRATGYFLALWLAAGCFAIMQQAFGGGGLITGLFSSMHLYMLAGNIGYFVGGYYLNKIDIPKWGRQILYAAGACLAVFSVLKTVADSRNFQTHEIKWLRPGAINVILVSAAIFVFFKYWKAPEWRGLSKWILTVEKTTFFVYMLHPFLLEKGTLPWIDVAKFTPVSLVPMMAVWAFLASVLVGLLAVRIPIVRKWIAFQ